MKSWLKNKVKNAMVKANHLMAPPNLVILNFHQVTGVFDPKKHRIGIWSQLDFFKEQMQYLKDHFDVVSLKDRQTNFDRLSIALTFDDGDPSITEVVVPLLSEYGLPATFFLNSAYFNNNRCSWPNLLCYFKESEKPKLPRDYAKLKMAFRKTDDPTLYRNLLNEIEFLFQSMPHDERFVIDPTYLSDLDNDLFTIGLHGHEHERFGMMPVEWQEADLKLNLATLQAYAAYIPVFAIPYGKQGDWNDHTLQLCAKLGLDVMSAEGGYNTKNHRGIFKRIPADGANLRNVLKNYSN